MAVDAGAVTEFGMCSGSRYQVFIMAGICAIVVVDFRITNTGWFGTRPSMIVADRHGSPSNSLFWMDGSSKWIESTRGWRKVVLARSDVGRESEDFFRDGCTSEAPNRSE